MSSENILILVASLAAGVIGNIILLIFIYLPYRKVSQSRSWLQTTGRVETSDIVMHSDSEGGSSPYPNVVYTYTVMGQALRGDHIQPGGDVGGMVAYKTIKKYPVGAQVTVYYDPQNPSDSLLERNVPGYVRWLWVALVFVNATICCCGILPIISAAGLQSGMKWGMPYLFQFIVDLLTKQ
jgi:hypothetical protein